MVERKLMIIMMISIRPSALLYVISLATIYQFKVGNNRVGGGGGGGGGGCGSYGGGGPEVFVPEEFGLVQYNPYLNLLLLPRPRLLVVLS